MILDFRLKIEKAQISNSDNHIKDQWFASPAEVPWKFCSSPAEVSFQSIIYISVCKNINIFTLWRLQWSQEHVNQSCTTKAEGSRGSECAEAGEAMFYQCCFFHQAQIKIGIIICHTEGTRLNPPGRKDLLKWSSDNTALSVPWRRCSTVCPLYGSPG